MCFDAGGNHNLDLNLGISPPALGNGSKENEGCLQFQSGPYNMHSGRSSRVNFELNLFLNLFVFLLQMRNLNFVIYF